MKYNVLIGGAAGQGMDTLSVLIEKVLKRKGYFIHSYKDYMSRIRGGHNFVQIRFGIEPIDSHWPELDIIIALDADTAKLHGERLSADGVILCDESISIMDKRKIHIPMTKFAKEVGNPKTSGSAAAGALFKLFGESLDKVSDIFNEKFESQVATANFEAFKKGYDYVEKKFDLPMPKEDASLLINSNQAIALGALAGGVGFFASYPMTPATSIMTYLAKKQNDAHIVVEQAEDEISAINMVLGASYAGVRSMTATSGGGYALMVEAMSLQGITEIPIVVVDSQRPGPATGLPTRTEQGDLDFVLFSGHGEYPKMVLAVKNAEDAFYQTIRALNIADKFQVQVIILTDEYLADLAQTIPPYDFSKLSIDRYLAKQQDESVSYRRYRYSEDGISPRMIPGQIEGTAVLIDSDEHDEEGHITESAEVRTAMMDKRMKKLELLEEEVQEPDYFGPDDPEILLIGWGSMYGPIKECIELLQKDNVAAGALVFGDLYPIPAKALKKYVKTAKKLVNVEMNYTGQLARLIRQETGIFMNHSLLNYDGRQMCAHTLYTRVKKEVL